MNQHQPSFIQPPVDQDTIDDPTVLSPGNDAGVGDDAATTSFTSLHELQTPSNQRPGYNKMRRRQLTEQFPMEKKGKAAKLSHNGVAGSAAASAALAPNGAPPGAAAAPDTVDRRANFGKGKQMPPPLPPADVDRNSLR
eukprot:2756999-Pleurochrysis_carterae.AAC.1